MAKFLHLFVVPENCIVCFKRPSINKKRPGMAITITITINNHNILFQPNKILLDFDQVVTSKEVKTNKIS